MASELSFLIPEFRSKVKALIAACKERNVRMDPYSTLVSPMEQASLWRQGRSAAEIELKILALDHAKAHFLAGCLRAGKAFETNRITNSLPGHSWNNWAEAANCVWIDSTNKLVWSPDKLDGPQEQNGYRIYAEEAAKLGLTSASKFDTANLTNWTTVQNRDVESPEDAYTIEEIDAEMQKRYSR